MIDIKKAVALANKKPDLDFGKLITFIYADKGAGKSTAASRFSRPFVIDCENRLQTVLMTDGTSVPKQVVYHWDNYQDGKSVRQVTKAFAGTTPEITGVDTIVVDGMGVAFKYLRMSILKKYKVDHENEGVLAYGRGKGLIIDELENWFTELRQLTEQGYGIVITSHERTIEFDNNGTKFDKKVPLISGDKNEYGWNAIKPFPHIVVHAYKTRGKTGPEHRMHLVGTDLWEASFGKPGVKNSAIADLIFSYDNIKKAWDES